MAYSYKKPTLPERLTNDLKNIKGPQGKGPITTSKENRELQSLLCKW